MITLKCQFCGSEKEVHNYRKNTFKFCDRSCLAKSKTGNKNPCWRGGRVRHSSGYIFIFIPNHPFSNKDGYYFEHRLMMEFKLNRFLKENEVVHHVNGIKDDNRIENLELLDSQSTHAKFHYKEREIDLDGRFL